MILPAWPDHTSKKSERCSSTGQILAVHKNVQLHRKKAKELGLQNSEYITFPNWAAQRPKQQLCRRPQEAQPMSDLCQAILQACRAAGSSEEATVLCLVKTSQWAYAQCVALADLVPWQAYQRVLFHIAVPGLEIAVQGWVDSYAVGSNRQLLVDFAPQLLHVLDHLKQHGELHPWHQSPCLRAWDQLGNWQILQLTEHYAYTTAAVGGQGALASPLSYQQTDRYAHTAADQDQAESDADSGTDVAWHNCASPLDAPFEWAASLSKSPDMHAPQCADVAISNAEEGFQPLWLDGNSLTGTSHVTAPLQQQHGTIHSMEANTDSSVGAKAAFPESCFAGPTSQPFTLQPVGGKPIVDVVIDAVGNPAEPYMLRVVNSAAESTMDLHASVLVKVAPESIPEVKAFMQHVSAIMSRAQNGDDSAILQMHQMCKVCKDEGILCNQLPQSLAQPHANSAATIEERERVVQLDEETHWRELQQSQPPVAMEWELLSLEELNTCYSAPTEQRNRFQGSASGCTKGMSRARISMHGNCVPMLGACAGFGEHAKIPLRSRCISLQPLRTLAILLRNIAGGAAKSSMTQLALVLIFLAAGCHLGLSPVLIMVCLLALPIVVMCLRLCSAQPRGRLQVQTDCGCTIM